MNNIYEKCQTDYHAGCNIHETTWNSMPAKAYIDNFGIAKFEVLDGNGIWQNLPLSKINDKEILAEYYGQQENENHGRIGARIKVMSRDEFKKKYPQSVNTIQISDNGESKIESVAYEKPIISSFVDAFENILMKEISEPGENKMIDEEQLEKMQKEVEGLKYTLMKLNSFTLELKLKLHKLEVELLEAGKLENHD